MRDYERREEYLAELAEAVFADNLERAAGVLEQMQREGLHSELIRRAKRVAMPGLRVTIDAPVREVFPMPGHAPGSFMGTPVKPRKVA
ncbi:hypothetical protein ACRAQ6_14060 [Erythrobacter sp. HA6-11]